MLLLFYALDVLLAAFLIRFILTTAAIATLFRGYSSGRASALQNLNRGPGALGMKKREKRAVSRCQLLYRFFMPNAGWAANIDQGFPTEGRGRCPGQLNAQSPCDRAPLLCFSRCIERNIVQHVSPDPYEDNNPVETIWLGNSAFC